MALDPTSALPSQALDAPLRVVFFGSPALAIPSLESLLSAPEFCEVVAVVAQPDRPAGRGQKLTPPPVARRARERGLPLLQPRKLKSGAFPESIDALAADLAVVVAYGRILTTRLLEAPRFGCINVHASLLPAYRGAGPIQWALIHGESETGVTTMWMEEGLDTGPILGSRSTQIEPGEDAGSLGRRLAQLGADLLVDTVRDLHRGTLVAQVQDHERASLAPLLSVEDGALDWTGDAVALSNRIRGVTPWPGAACFHGSLRLKVIRAEPCAEQQPMSGLEPMCPEPGQVVSSGDDGIRVRCGRGDLLLTRLQPAGRKALDAVEFLRGHRVLPGEYLTPSAPAGHMEDSTS
ncbi:MAG TPA: methionyl-tRNA formyltransferase [Deltaproteobacteria bacterium]|nr:methionyl-tRNA formyltransferase [Deltaproteobacteria bacterium]HCP48010.1 methionyl-tRNA formyltransferase [Deltaproteobacteria bacterium]